MKISSAICLSGNIAGDSWSYRDAVVSAGSVQSLGRLVSRLSSVSYA